MKRLTNMVSFVTLLIVPAFCFAAGGVTSSTATSPTWDPLLNLDPGSVLLSGPIFDSNGNAWVVTADSTDLIAVQSNGTSGTWNAPHIIGPYPSQPIGHSVGVAVDHAGGFYVTWDFGASASAWNLMWAKYTPSGGWQAPSVVFTNPVTFSRTFPLIDSTGRLVVVFNATASSSAGSSSIASNSAQTSWGSVQTLASNPDGVTELSVASNKSGTILALVQPLSPTGLYWTSFNSATGQWGVLNLIPGSLRVAAYYTDEPLPLSVDEAGNITFAAAITLVPTVICIPFVPVGCRLPVYNLGGFRYETGRWTEIDLVQPSYSFPYLGTYGSIATSPTGVVLIALPFEVGDSWQVTVLRYTPGQKMAGQAWDVEIADQFTEGQSFIPTQVAWFESTEPVVVYGKGIIPQPAMLNSALYVNGAWVPGPDVPGNLTDARPSGFPVALTGEALLGIDGGYVTFLRP